MEAGWLEKCSARKGTVHELVIIVKRRTSSSQCIGVDFSSPLVYRSKITLSRPRESENLPGNGWKVGVEVLLLTQFAEKGSRSIRGQVSDTY